MVGHPNPERSATIKVKMKTAKQTLLFIPVLFILLRMWCTVQYFYMIYLANEAQNKGWCIPVGLRSGHIVLGVFQVSHNESLILLTKIWTRFLLPNIITVYRLLEQVVKDGPTAFSMSLCLQLLEAAFSRSVSAAVQKCLDTVRVRVCVLVVMKQPLVVTLLLLVLLCHPMNLLLPTHLLRTLKMTGLNLN